MLVPKNGAHKMLTEWLHGTARVRPRALPLHPAAVLLTTPQGSGKVSGTQETGITNPLPYPLLMLLITEEKVAWGGGWGGGWDEKVMESKRAEKLQ